MSILNKCSYYCILYVLLYTAYMYEYVLKGMSGAPSSYPYFSKISVWSKFGNWGYPCFLFFEGNAKGIQKLSVFSETPRKLPVLNCLRTQARSPVIGMQADYWWIVQDLGTHPCYHVIQYILPCNILHVTMLHFTCYHVTMLPCYMLPCYLLPCHHAAVLLCYHAIRYMVPCYHVTMLPCYILHDTM